MDSISFCECPVGIQGLIEFYLSTSSTIDYLEFEERFYYDVTSEISERNIFLSWYMSV